MGNRKAAYRLLNKHGLLGLHRLGLWDASECLYFGTIIESAWEYNGLSELF